MLSDRLKFLRKKRNLTQIEFAKQFNISSGTIAMWETDKRTPDAQTLVKLADFFGCSVDYLLGRTEDSTCQTASLSPHEQQLILAYRTQPQMQESICRILGIDSSESR